MGTSGCSWGSWARLIPSSDGELRPRTPQLCSTSHSVSACSHFLPSHSLTLCLHHRLSCMPGPGPGLSFLHALLGTAHWQGLVGTSGACPSPLLSFLKLHPWVTRHGAEPLPSEDENCTLVEVTEEEVENSVKHIPSLATVVRREGPLTKSSREPEARLETAGLDTCRWEASNHGPENPVRVTLTHSHSLGQ